MIVRFQQGICIVGCGLEPFPLVNPFYKDLDMNHIFTFFFFFLKQVEHIVSYPQIWTCIKPMIQVLNIYVSRLKNTNAKFTLCIVEIKLLGLDMRNKPKFQCF